MTIEKRPRDRKDPKGEETDIPGAVQRYMTGHRTLEGLQITPGNVTEWFDALTAARMGLQADLARAKADTAERRLAGGRRGPQGPVNPQADADLARIRADGAKSLARLEGLSARIRAIRTARASNEQALRKIVAAAVTGATRAAVIDMYEDFIDDYCDGVDWAGAFRD